MQLVKAKDDLRQDAVMEQVFEMVNTLLRECSSPRAAWRRELGVRSYKVVPLSPSAGLVEWVQNTVALGEYLTGTPAAPGQGAHVRYNPGDLLPAECRKRMAEAHESRDKSVRARAFGDVCNHFTPVFHHFFLENFHTPADWFMRRLAFTQSSAASSIVGFILGLADRHSQNILIDKATAEVIHIDLGVAFDQGKALKTPEVVPFRLTRDVVDGMGGEWA